SKSSRLLRGVGVKEEFKPSSLLRRNVIGAKLSECLRRHGHLAFEIRLEFLLGNEAVRPPREQIGQAHVRLPAGCGSAAYRTMLARQHPALKAPCAADVDTVAVDREAPLSTRLDVDR